MLRSILLIARRPETLRRALIIALVVGTLLNLINQVEYFMVLDFAKISWIKFILTFMVPFLVSMYTAISINLQLSTGQLAPVDMHVKCVQCGDPIDVRESESVPPCARCGDGATWRLCARE